MIRNFKIVVHVVYIWQKDSEFLCQWYIFPSDGWTRRQEVLMVLGKSVCKGYPRLFTECLFSENLIPTLAILKCGVKNMKDRDWELLKATIVLSPGLCSDVNNKAFVGLTQHTRTRPTLSAQVQQHLIIVFL